MNAGLMIVKGNNILIYDEIFLCLMGGICFGLIGYFFPGWVYLNMMRERIKSNNKKMIYGLIGTVVILSGISTLIGVSVYVIKNVYS
jgi:H+/Cl- antiporter ClcA